MGMQVSTSNNDAGGATVASGAGFRNGNNNGRHPIGSSLVICLLFIIAILGVSIGVLYKQGRLAILQHRGFAFRRFQNANDDLGEPTIAMTGSRRTSGPYAHPREAVSDEGFVDESLGNYDIMPHSSHVSNRLYYQHNNYHGTSSDGLERVTLGLDEQPMFAHFSDGDPLVGDPPTSPPAADVAESGTVSFMPLRSSRGKFTMPPSANPSNQKPMETSTSSNNNKTPPKST